MRKLIIFIVLALLFAVCMLSFSCSPHKRFDRLARKHPELFYKDTVYDTVMLKTRVYVDTNKLKEANKGFDNSIDSALSNIDTLKKVDPCVKIAVKLQNNVLNARKYKQRIDTIYKESKCVIEPYFKSDSNILISAKVVNGNIVLDYTFKRFKYEGSERKFWQYWQFWWAFTGWVIVLLIVSNRVIK